MNWINWFKHIWKLSFGHKSYYFFGHFAAWKSLNPLYYITKSDQGLLQNLPFWVIWKKLERVIYHIYATHGAFCHFGNWQSQFSFNLLCWKEYKGICHKFPFCIIKIKYNHTDWKVNNDSIFIFGLAVYFTPLFRSKLLLSTSSKRTSLWQFCLHVWNSVKTCASVCVCVSAGMGRGMILSQAHCAGSVSMALTHIHHHHISSSFLSLTQTLRNAAALLCTRMFHFSPDSKQPTYKLSAENMYEYLCACLFIVPVGELGFLFCNCNNVKNNPTCLLTT